MHPLLAAALLAALVLAPAAEATGISDALNPPPRLIPGTAPPVPGCKTFNFTQVMGLLSGLMTSGCQRGGG